MLMLSEQPLSILEQDGHNSSKFEVATLPFQSQQCMAEFVVVVPLSSATFELTSNIPTTKINKYHKSSMQILSK